MAHGTHDSLEDDRNREILINVNGAMFERDEAKVSVFDSGFMLGDGVWEGLRLHQGKLAFLDEHLGRLYEAAKAIDLDIGKTREELARMLTDTLAANGMSDDVHVRLMVTRGPKKTPFQDPRLSLWGPTIVIIPEYKVASPDTYDKGIRLFTVHVHRGMPDAQDPKLNSHSKLNCIVAMIQAIKAGADEGLMLDPHGFVSTCNSTNFFIVTGGEVWTSTGEHCLHGITRALVLDICTNLGILTAERDFALAEVYTASESFVTGTLGGLTPVVEVDGRPIGGGKPGPITARLTAGYRQLIDTAAESS